MGCKVDQYPDSVYSLCMVCKQCKVEDNSHCINRVSSSAINVITCNSYSCLQARFEEDVQVPYKTECTSFLEDDEKVAYYKKNRCYRRWKGF